MTYTEKELDQFLHGISLSLLSKKSAQHWRYDEETAKEIEWLEALERKVRADKADRKAEPRRGKWILTSDEKYEYCTCSECGYENGENWMIGSEIPYCANCGAKMVETEPSGYNLLPVDKDINVRSKTEPRKEQNFCGKCRYLYRDFKYGLSCYRLMDNEPCKYEKRKAEPQTSCKTCRYGEVDEGYVRCAYYSKATEQDEPQTEPLQTCSVNGRPYSECFSCEHFKCTADEPQTDCAWGRTE